MKKIFLWGLCFLLAIAIIPFITGIINGKNKADLHINFASINKPKAATASESADLSITLTNKDIETIVCLTMEYIEEDTDKETKRAILSICTNNYIKSKADNNISPQVEISSYNDNLLKELTEIYNNGIYELRYQNNIVYIPVVSFSHGYIATNDEYPYIEAVASPWDTLCAEYNDSKKSECGVSLYGIEYLCKSHSDAESALRWYLPDFEMNLMK